jgi:ABC-type transport system involved in multi-copper enzyme maturation permease subunit
MKSRAATIARYTLLEALRTRLPVLSLVVLALLVAAGFFVEQIAVTEGVRFRTGFYAAAARWATVFIVALHVIAAVAREFDDKALDVLLALDLPRSHYVLGRLAGFAAVAAIVAAAACVPLAWFVPAGALAQWGISLAVELAIVAALALFCAITFNQIVPAAGFVAGFYVLARALTAMRLISANPISGADALSHQALGLLVEGLALVLPGLEGWTRTDWLVNQPAPWAALAVIAAQGALYVALLAGAAMFDLHRKNF